MKSLLALPLFFILHPLLPNALPSPQGSSDAVLIHPSENGLPVASPSINKGALSIFRDNSTIPNSQNIPLRWANYCDKPARVLCRDLASPGRDQIINNVWVWRQFHGGCLVGGFLPMGYAPDNSGLEDPDECENGYLGPMQEAAHGDLGITRVSVNVLDFPTAAELPGTAVEPMRPRWIMQG